MNFDYSIIELNKYIVGLGSWIPGPNLYLGLYTALSGITFTSGNKIGLDEANYDGYNRIAISSGNWNIQYLTGSSRLNNTQLFNFNSYPYISPTVQGYFITDVPTGTGVVVSYGSLAYSATLNQSIDLSFSGIYMSISQNQPLSPSSPLGGINITPTGTRLLFNHLIGTQPLQQLSFKPADVNGNEYDISFTLNNLDMATTGNNYIHNTTSSNIPILSGEYIYIYRMNIYLGEENYGYFRYKDNTSEPIGRIDCGGTFILPNIPGNTYSNNIVYPFISFNILYD